MSTINAETNLKKSKEILEKVGVAVDEPLLEKIIKGLGIANQSLDASLVSAADKSEVERLKANYVVKKLGVTDDADADQAIANVLSKLSDVKQKQRGAVCYLLVEELGKQDVYA